ncbi:MAG: PAS domain S-box protein [Candidatus Cloacimonadales bacterium]|nr:PAS domain S-box protein [Candidatus Cloacimonadales bacterium]
MKKIMNEEDLNKELQKLRKQIEMLTAENRELNREKSSNKNANLLESDKKYRTLFKSSRDAIMMLAPPDWFFIAGNRSTLKMFRAKDEQEFISKEPWKLSPEYQPDGQLSSVKAKAMIEKAMKTGSHFFEWTHSRITGEDFPATVLLTRIKLEGKQLLQATVRDISKQKKTEEELENYRQHLEKLVAERTNELKESEEKFRTITENINLGIYRNTAGSKGRFIEVNPAFVKMFGFESKAELMNLTVSDLYEHPEDRKKYNELLTKDGFLKAKELSLKKKNGDIFIASIYAVAIKDENGEFQYFDGVIEDITEKKNMEIALKESEEKFRGLFENSTDIVFTLDLTGHITDVNRALENNTHYKRKEILGANIISLFSEGIGKNLIDAIESVGKTGKPVHDFLLDITRRNGEKLYWECSLILMKKDDKPCGFQGSLRDVTKRQEAELELLKHQDHLKLINSILRHDIANCFAVINSALNLYRRSHDITMLDEAVLQIKKGISLISKMKELEEYFISRSDLRKVDLVPMLKEIASQYSNLKTTIIGKATVLADEALESTFDNLFTNAFIHGKATEIEINITQENDHCRIIFADNGSGIADKIKTMIFEKAFKSGTTGNTGLGLYIVKKTIDRYGGSIEVDDNEPQGAKFIIELRCMK